MQTIRLYDMKTEKITEMPVAELSTDVVRVSIEGIGIVYVYVKDLTAISEPKLPRSAFKDALPLIEEIRKTFAEVRPLKSAQWVDGFRADSHPEKEIAVWAVMADCYRHLLKGNAYNKAERREVFGLLLMTSMGGTVDEVLSQCPHKRLGNERAREIFQTFRAGRYADDEEDDEGDGEQWKK